MVLENEKVRSEKLCQLLTNLAELSYHHINEIIQTPIATE